jgi:hypothetical protein
MKNFVKKHSVRIFQPAFRWFFNLIVLVLGLSFASCEDDPAACEMQNTGTFIVENGAREGTLEVHFNQARPGRKGDLSLQPGEQGSIELPAGKVSLLARLVVSDCVGSRCRVQSTTRNDSEEDLAPCETRNFIF